MDNIIGPQCGFSLDQSANDDANRQHPDTLAAKLAKLEAEVATLRAEVRMLRSSQQRHTGGQIRERFGTDFICK